MGQLSELCQKLKNGMLSLSCCYDQDDSDDRHQRPVMNIGEPFDFRREDPMKSATKNQDLNSSTVKEALQILQTTLDQNQHQNQNHSHNQLPSSSSNPHFSSSNPSSPTAAISALQTQTQNQTQTRLDRSSDDFSTAHVPTINAITPVAPNAKTSSASDSSSSSSSSGSGSGSGNGSHDGTGNKDTKGNGKGGANIAYALLPTPGAGNGVRVFHMKRISPLPSLPSLSTAGEQRGPMQMSGSDGVTVDGGEDANDEVNKEEVKADGDSGKFVRDLFEESERDSCGLGGLRP